MSDFNAKMHPIRFWLGRCPRPRGNNLQRSLIPQLVGGGLTALPILEPQNSQCRDAAKYVLMKLHCTSENSFVYRLSSSHQEDPLFYSTARTLAGIQELQFKRQRGPGRMLGPAQGRQISKAGTASYIEQKLLSFLTGYTKSQATSYSQALNSNFGRFSYSFREIDTFSYKIEIYSKSTICAFLY